MMFFYVLVNLLDLCILVATDWFMNIESRIEMMFFLCIGESVGSVYTSCNRLVYEHRIKD